MTLLLIVSYCCCLDDVIKWKHFLHYWHFVRGIHQSPVNSPHKSQWCRALVFSLIWVGTNSWANQQDDGDLRWHHAHYDVTVMVNTDIKLGDDNAPMIFDYINWILRMVRCHAVTGTHTHTLCMCVHDMNYSPCFNSACTPAHSNVYVAKATFLFLITIHWDQLSKKDHW